MKLRYSIRAAFARVAAPFTFAVGGVTTAATARPAWTATAGRVAVPFTFAALCGRMSGKPPRKSAPPTARRPPPSETVIRRRRIRKNTHVQNG